MKKTRQYKHERVFNYFLLIFLASTLFSGCAKNIRIDKDPKKSELLNVQPEDNVDFYKSSVTWGNKIKINGKKDNFLFLFDKERKILFAAVLGDNYGSPTLYIRDLTVDGYQGSLHFFGKTHHREAYGNDEYREYCLLKGLICKDSYQQPDNYQNFLHFLLDTGKYILVNECTDIGYICKHKSSVETISLSSRKLRYNKIDFEILDYNKLISIFEVAIKKKDISLLKNIHNSLPDVFINKNLFASTLKSESKLENILTLRKVASKLGSPQLLSQVNKRENQINFDNKYSSLLSDVSISQIDTVLNSGASLEGVDFKKIQSLNKRKHSLIRNKVLSQGSIEDLMAYLVKHPSDEEVKSRLIGIYRVKANIAGYKKSYEISSSTDDLSNIIKLSNSIEQLENYLAEYGSSDYSNRAKAEIKLLKEYRELNTLNGYLSAFQLLSHTQDGEDVLKRSNTINTLKIFLTNHEQRNHKITKKAKNKLQKLYREDDTYESYTASYKLLNKTYDLEKAYDKAKTVKQKAAMENLVFDMIKTKGSMVNIDLTLKTPSFSKNNSGGGFFSQSTQYGYMSTYGDLFVSFDKKNLPFQPKYGEYKVSVVLELTIPRSKQVRSKWVGNRDAKANVTETTTVSLYLLPPYNKIKKGFNFMDKTFVYFDRGSTGGFTAIWPSDYPSVKVKKVTVAYNRQSETKNRKFDIEFNKIKNYSRTIIHPKAYVSNAYKTGVEWINNFANNSIGQYKNYSSSEYSSSSSSSSNSAHASSDNSANNSSSRQSGVKEYYDGGYKSSKGSKIYIVKCNDGTKVSVHKQVNGSWYSVSSNTGSKYKNLSISAFANKYCS